MVGIEWMWEEGAGGERGGGREKVEVRNLHFEIWG